ncbi:hypothetical protein AVEN_62805-1 [Araneus ventricosus]|uniref:Uncharacterized protein n=1 Tax=Araneus ventricosus TaxID=182803 RepID=A0A4Y2NZX0_ARAVE|nr:hypothetical protein AVEN_62805-1 [Araneus ventricosus]
MGRTAQTHHLWALRLPRVNAPTPPPFSILDSRNSFVGFPFPSQTFIHLSHVSFMAQQPKRIYREDENLHFRPQHCSSHRNFALKVERHRMMVFKAVLSIWRNAESI